MKPCATRIFSLPQNHSCHSPFSQSHQKDSRSPLTISVLYIKESESESHSAMFNSLRPHVLYSPWNFPGQNTGEGSLSLLQGIFPNQGSNPGIQPRSPALQVDSLPTELSGKSKHASTLSQNLSPIRSLHNIEQNSLCYTVGLYWLSILNIAVCTCWF